MALNSASWRAFKRMVAEDMAAEAAAEVWERREEEVSETRVWRSWGEGGEVIDGREIMIRLDGSI